jgi:plastocyanin
MSSRIVLPFAILIALCLCLHAEVLDGTIVIKKKLTKRRVTATIPMYERGPVVELDSSPTEKDPLAFERSRVAVYLDGTFPSPVGAPTPAKMEQQNQQFSPEFLVIEAGAKVAFPNLDPIFHNVFSLSNAKSFDLGNYPKGDTRVVTFTKPGIVSVNCHLHANMTGTIVVTPNRWNARAGSDGHFEFSEVPPGQYTVVAWHKAAGFFRQQVRIEPGRSQHIEFLIPVDEEGRKLESRIATAGAR